MRKIYEAQTCISNTGDCVNLVEEDSDKFDMLETDEQISKMSKEN